MQNTFKPSDDLQQELQHFLTGHNVALLNQHMRRQLIDYLDYELRTNVPLYFDEFLYPYNCLLDLLDKAANELNEYATIKKTNAQTLTANQSTTEKVMAFIKASLSPEKIFLLCHNINADNAEYFDLLVTIPETTQTGFSHYEQVISMAHIDNATIHVSLHKSITLQKQVEEGHIFYSIACNRQNLVYDNNSTPLPTIKNETLQLIKEKASNEFYAGFKKAESFLQGASVYWGENNMVTGVFMLHQAVEIALRSLVMALLGNCPKTHCFKELEKPLKRCAPELLFFLSGNEEEENRLLRLLEKAYLEARYNSSFAISDNDFTLLTEGAEELHERVGALFGAKMEKLGVDG